MSDLKTYRLPPVFYDDHRARALPEFGHSEAVGATKRNVTVEMDAPAYDDLLSDARHHAYHMASAGFDGYGLIASARATVAALEKQGRP